MTTRLHVSQINQLGGISTFFSFLFFFCHHSNKSFKKDFLTLSKDTGDNSLICKNIVLQLYNQEMDLLISR